MLHCLNLGPWLSLSLRELIRVLWEYNRQQVKMSMYNGACEPFWIFTSWIPCLRTFIQQSFEGIKLMVFMTGLQSYGCCSNPMVTRSIFGHLAVCLYLWHQSALHFLPLTYLPTLPQSLHFRLPCTLLPLLPCPPPAR